MPGHSPACDDDDEGDGQPDDGLSRFGQGDGTRANFYGQTPLLNGDALTPNEEYFKIVDAMVNPDRQHLAYLTLTSSVLSLYMKPLANDNTPVLVADAVSTDGAGSAVLAEWRDG